MIHLTVQITLEIAIRFPKTVATCKQLKCIHTSFVLNFKTNIKKKFLQLKVV